MPSRPPPLFELRVSKGLARLALAFPGAMPVPRLRVRLRYYIESMLLAENYPPDTASIMNLLIRYTQFIRQIASGKPIVLRRLGTLALMFDAFSVQSEMRIESPNELMLGYTQFMMGVLLLRPAPHSIAMIGLGGGSLLKFCYRHLPRAVIDVAEIDAEVIAVRDRFSIPADDARLTVHCIDGAEFVRESKKRYDVLMVDGFDRRGQPAQLCSEAFYDSCYQTLAPDGVMVVNLLGDSMLETLQAVERMRASFYGAVLDIDTLDSPNRIIFACKNGLPELDATVLQQRIDELAMVCPMALHAIARALRTGRALACSPV
jgi:spermidine synthase